MRCLDEMPKIFRFNPQEVEEAYEMFRKRRIVDRPGCKTDWSRRPRSTVHEDLATQTPQNTPKRTTILNYQ